MPGKEYEEEREGRSNPASRMSGSVEQRKGILGVKQNRVRSLREMTSFYKGQKERGERVTDNVGMSS